MIVSCHLANAQEKKCEISVGASWGISFVTGNEQGLNYNSDGLSLKFDVNLDYYFNPKWSLMTGIGLWGDRIAMDEFDGD